MPVAFSGGVAVLAAFIQSITMPEPVVQIGPYLVLWIGAAVVSLLATGLEMMIRAAQFKHNDDARTDLARARTILSGVVAGALVTVVLVRAAPESRWMLPGLWQIIFALGIFASCRLLPRPTFWVAVFYLGTGLAALVLAHGDRALTPWSMGLPFGVGQVLAALVLYRTLERDHV